MNNKKKSADFNFSNYQEATAKVLSKNKIKGLSDQSIQVKNSLLRETLIVHPNLPESNLLLRGYVDLHSLSLRYNSELIFRKFCPDEKIKKELFKILMTSRSLALGFREYCGCKKNIKKILKKLILVLNKNQDKEIDSDNYKSIFDFFLNILEKRKITGSASFLKKYPKMTKKKYQV